MTSVSDNPTQGNPTTHGIASTTVDALKGMLARVKKLPASLLSREAAIKGRARSVTYANGRREETPAGFGRPYLTLSWTEDGGAFLSVATREIRVRSRVPYLHRETDSGTINIPIDRLEALVRATPADTDVKLSQVDSIVRAEYAPVFRVRRTAPARATLKVRIDLVTAPVGSEQSQSPVPDHVVTLKGPELSAALVQCGPFTSDGSRYSGASNVCLDIAGDRGVSAVATDGKLLASVRLESFLSGDAPERQLLIPPDAVKLLAELSSGWPRVAILTAESWIVCRNPEDDSEIWIKQGDGRFPMQYREFLADASTGAAELQVKPLVKALKSLDPRGTYHADEDTVHVATYGNHLVLNGNSGSTQVPMLAVRGNWSLGLGRKALLSILAECARSAPNVILKGADPSKPLRLESNGSVFLLMPLKEDDPAPTPEPEPEPEQAIGHEDCAAHGIPTADPSGAYFAPLGPAPVAIMAPICGGSEEAPAPAVPEYPDPDVRETVRAALESGHTLLTADNVRRGDVVWHHVGGSHATWTITDVTCGEVWGEHDARGIGGRCVVARIEQDGTWTVPPTAPQPDPEDTARHELRALQDRYLALRCVRRFVAEHSENNSLWTRGPSAWDVAHYIYPDYRHVFEDAIREHSDPDPDPDPTPPKPKRKRTPRRKPVAPAPTMAFDPGANLITYALQSFGPDDVLRSEAFPPFASWRIDTESVDTPAPGFSGPDPAPGFSGDAPPTDGDWLRLNIGDARLLREPPCAHCHRPIPLDCDAYGVARVGRSHFYYHATCFDDVDSRARPEDQAGPLEPRLPGFVLAALDVYRVGGEALLERHYRESLQREAHDDLEAYLESSAHPLAAVAGATWHRFRRLVIELADGCPLPERPRIAQDGPGAPDDVPTETSPFDAPWRDWEPPVEVFGDEPAPEPPLPGFSGTTLAEDADRAADDLERRGTDNARYLAHVLRDIAGRARLVGAATAARFEELSAELAWL